MQYKSIVLQLLEQRPETYGRLRKNRRLPATLNRHARQLRKRHLAWIDLLAEDQPDISAIQLANQALEYAVKELEKALPSEQPPEDSESLSLDAAMAFITRHTPPA